MATGIYAIVHMESGRCYVGQSVCISKRWSRHRGDLRRGKHSSRHLQNCWDKYGEGAFEFLILEECEQRNLTEREKSWLESLDSPFNTFPAIDTPLAARRTAEFRARARANQLGKTSGMKGRKHTPEALAKMSAAHKGHIKTPETCAKLSASLKGVKKTPEHAAKIGAAKVGNKYNLGIVRSPEFREKVSASKKGASLGPWSEARRAAHKKRSPAPEERLRISETLKRYHAERRRGGIGK